MREFKISRRVFLGAASATAIFVAAPELVLALDTKTGIKNVIEPGQFFNASEMTILVDIAEIMIPRTETPGATDAHVIPVLDAMMLTWASTKTQDQFKEMINQIEQLALNTFQSAYHKLPKSDREKLITQVDSSAFKDKASDLLKSYRKFKDITFHIYYTSEEANPNYALVPGDYRGCLTESELSEINKRGYLE